MVINSIGRFVVVPVLVFLAGCAAVGPNYVPPKTGAPGVWHTELKDGLVAQKTNPETLANWWKTLNDPILSELIKRAVAGNLDLKKARARVRSGSGHPLFSRR